MIDDDLTEYEREQIEAIQAMEAREAQENARRQQQAHERQDFHHSASIDGLMNYNDQVAVAAYSTAPPSS